MTEELSDAEDWLAASRALEKDDELKAINVAVHAQPASKRLAAQRSARYDRIHAEKLLELGMPNPRKATQEDIDKTREQRRKGWFGRKAKPQDGN